MASLDATAMAASADALPLVSRPGDAVLFRRGAEAVTAARFLADVAATAAALPGAPPGGGHAANLCDDRYLALVAFGAAAARGWTTLLWANRDPARLRALAARFPGAWAIAEGDAADGTMPVIRPRLAGAGAPAAANPMIPRDLVAALAFTSGSTGEPTAHRKRWEALVLCAEAAAERFRLRSGDGAPATLVATVPPQHMYGFETTLMLPLRAGAGHAGPVFYPRDVAEALAAVPERRLLVSTPLQLRALLASGAALPPLAAVISATAPLSPALAAEAEAAWGAPLLEIYGATEAGSLASRRTVRGERWTPYRGTAVLAGADGAGLARVPGLGEVALADEVEALDDGGFRLLGRRSDLVKLAGRRASLAELNRQLLAVEGVHDGAFVAPDDLEADPGARLAALAVAPGRQPGEILAALRRRLEPVFLPRPLVLLDALPRDALGKLPRAAALRAVLDRRAPVGGSPGAPLP